MSDIFYTFLLSMIPVGELRLAIPVGILIYQLDVFLVFFVSVFGNLIPAIFLLFFLKKISVYLSNKSAFFKKIFTWWEDRSREKHIAKIQRYEIIGLALFVAIPFPMTGAWTGALLATIMNLPLKKSLTAIICGVFGAGLIVTALITFGVSIEQYFGWQILLGALIFILLIFVAKKFIKH